MTRAVVFVLACAIALAACDRFVDLTPPPDAHTDGRIGDSALPDGGAIGDAFIPTD